MKKFFEFFKFCCLVSFFKFNQNVQNCIKFSTKVFANNKQENWKEGKTKVIKV